MFRFITFVLGLLGNSWTVADNNNDPDRGGQWGTT